MADNGEHRSARPPYSIPPDPAVIAAAVEAHDQATASCPAVVWVGAEPTFTDRFSEAPEWVSEAPGADKERRAQELVRLLAAEQPGALVMRPLGRQYPGEPEPRFCYGLYAHRDGTAVWQGPVDRLQDGAPSAAGSARATALASALITALRAAKWSAEPVTLAAPAPQSPLQQPPLQQPPLQQPPPQQAPPQRAKACTRIVCRPDGKAPACDAGAEPRLARPTIHAGFVEDGVQTDELAQEGLCLCLIHAGAGGESCNELWLELPAFDDVDTFEGFLAALARACQQVRVTGLGLRGFAPPVDDRVAWTTLTPDPAVLEVNQAPQPDMQSFYRESRLLFALAERVSLSPYRLHYNGEASDSGGGGQLTFGGPSPETSPFFRSPQLLPRLIRYLIRHPSLSYWFATRYIGGSSQSPRPDEGVRESFLELAIGLEQLALVGEPSPEQLWGTLRHFLADASGNPHRSELNIEKLHNPHLPGRGCLGLVEFRALAMAKSPEASAARAMLLRSILVMLQASDPTPELADWGGQLHDRFALPFFLRADLREVFSDLRRAGVALGEAVEALLVERPETVLREVEFQGVKVRLEQALEFWPLVGDVTWHSGGSRLVDASTARIQVRLLPGAGTRALSDWAVGVNGCHLPMRVEPTPEGDTLVLGVRYRSFSPWLGLHPSLPPVDRIVVTAAAPSGRGLRLTLHDWRPDGLAYEGLPKDPADAAARRWQRVVVETCDRRALPTLLAPPAQAVTQYCLDLRRVKVGAKQAGS